MRNILIINHHASIPKYGGGGRHHQFASELSKRNYNVTLIASSYAQGKKEYLHNYSHIKEKINNNYEFIMIRTSPAYKNNLIKRLFNYIDFKNKVERLELTDKPDVVVASSVHPFTWIAGYKLAKKYKAKFVVEVRDLWPLSLYEDINKIIRPYVFMFFNRLEKKYYNLASSIIVTAPNAHKYINEKYDIKEENIYFIPHCIDINEFDENVEKKISKPIDDLLKNYFCVTYTGALSKSEGLENFLYLANRFKKYNNIKFLIIGSGSEKESLVKIQKQMSLNNVEFFDRLPRKNIPSILTKSCVLFTGLMERKAFKYGISKNKFYDYMAAQKPVIFMSNVKKSAIEKANCGYVIKDHSIDEAENELVKLYSDGKLRQTLSKNGRKYVEKHHTIEIITDQFIKAIM